MLGQGGFGITYLATQTFLQRKVAIKEFFMKDFCSRDSHTMYMQSFTSEFSYKLYLKFLCDRLGVGGAAYLGGDRLLA